MNLLPNNLKDAKGYRSPFINNLNANVIANRIIGGDVIPSTSADGTTLHLKNGEGKKSRWQMFFGVTPLKRSVVAIADGAIYIDNTLIKLKNGINGKYVKQGLLPRGGGWYYDASPSSSWNEMSAIIYRYKSQSSETPLYYLLFAFDGAVPTSEVAGYAEGDEIVEVVKIATYTKATNKIEQFITSDIYISSVSNVEPVDVTVVEPWVVRKIDNVWSIYMPNINALVAPYGGQLGLWQLPSVYSSIKSNGWIALSDLGIAPSSGYLNVIYSPLSNENNANIYLSATSLTSTSRQFTVGLFEADSSGNLTWSQWRKGHVVFDVSRHSPPYVANLNYQGIESHATDITSSAEGCYINRTHWLEYLMMGDEVLGSNNHTNSNGEYVIATMGQKMVFKASLFSESNTIKQTSGGMFPNAKASDASTVVATQEEQTRVEGILTDTPTDETQQGRVYAGSRSSIVWVAQTSGEAVETDILYTEVEEANEATTYSDSSGLE